MSTPNVLLIGVDEETKSLIKELLIKVNVIEIPAEPSKIIGIDHNLKPCLILVKAVSEKEGIAPKELIQLIRNQFNVAPCFLYFKSIEGFSKSLVSETAYNGVFLLPNDTFLLRSCMSEIITVSSLGTIRFYRSVKIIEIEAGDILNFDTNLYLPLNRKYIKISSSGESLDSEKIQKIKNHQFNNIHISIEQLKYFYEYTARKLKKISTSTMGLTEKREKLLKSVRDLMLNLFESETATYESGQEILKDCAEIVKTYILQDATSDWYQRINRY